LSEQLVLKSNNKMKKTFLPLLNLLQRILRC